MWPRSPRVEIDASGPLPALHAARVITGLTVRPSPPWLAQRLRAVGLRPINNVVDVTNYVLWELGQPLHAFDHDRWPRTSIVVAPRAGRRAPHHAGRAGARPDPDMLMICDIARPVAIGLAGVMGGADSEVRPETSAVLLESAHFNPGSIRRTSRALGLLTDAAYRFERGADIEGARRRGARSRRAAHRRAGRGHGRPRRDRRVSAPRARPRMRSAHRARVQRVIGVGAAARRGRADPPGAGLRGGDERPRARGRGAELPARHRQEDDLVEEIIRVWGYDRIPLDPAHGGELASSPEPGAAPP